MVIVACKCLNITTTIADNDIDLTTRKPFAPSPTFSPTAAPRVVEFLKEAVGPFTNPSNLRIETKHDELTGTRRVQITVNGSTTPCWWALVNCLNCDQPVYATRTTTPAAGPIARKSISAIDDPAVNPRNDDFAVVFNGKLLTTLEAINTLKAGDSYSKIYKVIIRQRSSTLLSMLSSSSPPKRVTYATDDGSASELINSTDPRLKNLNSLLNERLRKETEATEERIRQYTADQFGALKEFRQASEAEFVHLAQKLLAEPAQQPPNELLLSDAGNKKLISISVVGGMLLETPPLTPDSGTMTMGNSPPRLMNSSSARSLGPIMNSSSSGGGVGGLKMASRFNALRKRNSDAGAASTGGLEDEDDFFGMDGFFPGNAESGGQAQPMSDFDEDFDEEDELEVNKDANDTGRHIPMRSDYLGQSAGAMNIAKSLPMPTPALPNRAHPDDSDEGLDNNVDIAASIKALAKSVHRSDDIFGDLPRPRLRTKI